jgi:hydrogenase maturation protein HypF
MLGATMATIFSAAVRRKHIDVRGIVQGVGFRPFVYNLARSLRLAGYVFNSSSGVTIEIEGSDADVSVFLRTLRSDPPQLAAIATIAVSDIAVREDAAFLILESHEELGAFSLISPDAAPATPAGATLGDPHNRRFGYPFTNCTHCGPRYTIIQDIPYDRATTTMAAVHHVPRLRGRVRRPRDRRFHAQPNACAVCGPFARIGS